MKNPDSLMYGRRNWRKNVSGEKMKWGLRIALSLHGNLSDIDCAINNVPVKQGDNSSNQ